MVCSAKYLRHFSSVQPLALPLVHIRSVFQKSSAEAMLISHDAHDVAGHLCRFPVAPVRRHPYRHFLFILLRQVPSQPRADRDGMRFVVPGCPSIGHPLYAYVGVAWGRVGRVTSALSLLSLWVRVMTVLLYRAHSRRPHTQEVLARIGVFDAE